MKEKSRHIFIILLGLAIPIPLILTVFCVYITADRTYLTRVANDIYSDFMESDDVTPNEKQKLINCLDPNNETFNTEFCIDLVLRASEIGR